MCGEDSNELPAAQPIYHFFHILDLHNIGGTAYMFDEVTCRGSSVEKDK
jgi:hypothetical protein